MTTLECIEFISMTDGGGKFTDENRANPMSLLSVLNTGRGVAITQRYAKGGDIHPNFIQTVHPAYEEELQEDDCYELFRIPRAVDINDMMDGYLFMGSRSGKARFTRIKNRNNYFNMIAHRVGRALLENGTFWRPDPDTGTAIVYKKGVKKVFLDMVAEDPTSVPGFNIEVDDYPITMDALKKVEEMVRQGTIFAYLKYPTNKASNSQDDSQLKPTEV